MKRYFASILFLIIIAVLVRLPELSQRPLHVDEAVNAYILGTLIESGTYQYNPGEYHGPTLYYFSLIFTSIFGSASFAQLNEFIIRIIPVFTGVLIVLLTFLIGRTIRSEVGLIAGIVVSVSPVMVYFNRYFIHESLLVAISLGIILLAIKYSQNRRLVTAIYLGICIGLLIATKETWVLYMSALVLSYVILHWVQKDFTSLTTKHLILGISAVGIIITILFSSFFTNWPGMVSFTESFQKYFIRGTTTPEHTHPWYYYIKLLFFYNEGERWFFSETAVLALAIPGIIAGTRRQYGLISLFVTSYFIILLTLFSLIPYKTPWNILGLIPAMAILAGIGYSFIRETYKPNKYLFNAICIILLVFLVNQSCEINYRYSDSPDNPYTYGHARESVKQVSNELDKFRKIYPDLEDVRIDVIAKNGSYWPLPWYLREYPHIAWRDDIPDNIASVPIVLITPDLESNFISQIYEKTPFEKRNLYLPIFKDDIELRPGVMIRGYMHKILWEKILANSSGE